MNKSELRAALTKQTVLTAAQADIALNAVFDRIIPDQLAEGNEIAIAGFGKFTATVRDERTGRNPQTGEAITIAAKVAVKFKPASALKDKVN
jgi:DNA-binding protein HU-beta